MTRTRHGMTLIELTVALTITGVALSVGYSAFGTLSDRRMRADSRADAIARSATIRRDLSAWLANARLTIEEDEIVFRAVDGTHRSPDGDEADDELTFFTSAPTPVAIGGTIIHLYVERSDSLPAGDRGLIADLAAWHDQHRLRMVIDTSVSGLDAAFLSSVLGERTWLPSWVSTTVLPAGARLTFHPRAGDTLAALLREPLTVSLENGR